MRTILVMAAITFAFVHESTWAGQTVDPIPGPSALSLEFAVGPGWGRTSDNVFRVYDDYTLVPRLSAREGGPALQLGIDFRLVDELALGIGVSTWSRDADNDLATAHFDLTLVAARTTWYPWRGHVFARLGYGLGIARLEYLERGIADTRNDVGTGYLLGVGYHIRLGGAVSLTPQITTLGFATRDLEVWASSTTLALGVTIELGV